MDEIDRLLSTGRAVISVREHPELARLLQRRCAAGELTRFAPGVYGAAALASDPDTRIMAAARWAGNGVLTGRAAARLSFWPDIPVSQITLSVPAKRQAAPGVALARERIPAELIFWRGPLCLTAPALTALDLVPDVGGEGIDRALLSGRVALADMHRALELTPRRRGNGVRRMLLHDSRSEPWSEAERRLHALLRVAGIGGWRANVEVRVGALRFSIDVEFDGLMLGIEVDGYSVHGPGQWAQYQRDRRKWSLLTSAGWRLLHFTWNQLSDEPDWVVATILSSIDLARAERASGSAVRGRRGRSAT